MIPEHRADGRLPVGIHSATWADVVARFGGSHRRQLLLRVLAEALQHLADAGCTTAWLGGSFVSNKTNPGDVDVVWDVTGVDPTRVHPMFLDPWIGREFTKVFFGGDYFPSVIVEGDSGLPFVEFFQTSREDGPVGIVTLDLTTLE